MKKVILSVVLMFASSVSAQTLLAQQASVKSGTPVKATSPVQATLLAHQQQHFVRVQLTQLSDNAGLNYIGGVVSANDLSPYLAQLKQRLGDEFADYRQGQKLRDHSQFHITLVNPYEYKALTKQQQKIIAQANYFDFALLGLGHVNKGAANTYFVVAQSEKAQGLRTQLGLKPKDFHATLGFIPQDIYGVAKDTTTLVK